MTILCINPNWELISTITIPSLLVIVGWVVVYVLNKRNEIAKERRGYRIDMLRSVFDFRNEFIRSKTEDYNPKLFDIAYSNILLYGKKDEFLHFESMRDAMEKSQYRTDEETVEVLNYIQKMSDLCIDRIRKELKLEKVEEIYAK